VMIKKLKSSLPPLHLQLYGASNVTDSRLSHKQTSLTTLGWYAMFFFFICFSIHLYLAQCINPKPFAEKTILNIENFRGNIHNVMSKKQPEVRSRTAFLSCILTISTGSISGHNLSFGLYIQAMAFSKISASLSCLLLVCCAFVILY